MNFFESQDRARKHTTALIILFGVAILAIIIVTNVLLVMFLGLMNDGQQAQPSSLMHFFNWKVIAAVSFGIVIVVLAGSLYKISILSAGGEAVAQALGGQLIPQNTTDPHQRKLLNVVEEMAIASGTPAPPVFLLSNESGINAFAAGFSPRDAVIGITQGAIEHLNREQLQGVVAHEFSHIFNGDMRLNIKLTGVLHGLLIVGNIGYRLFRLALRHMSSGGRKNSARGILFVLALGLMGIGFVGNFFGALIKAMISRQREYLADACAVQFTRNPNGIAGALKRIGGLAEGSLVKTPEATEISHAFFAQAVSGFLRSISATHPPLEQRILRIDPSWDGRFLDPGLHASPLRPLRKETRRYEITVPSHVDEDGMESIKINRLVDEAAGVNFSLTDQPPNEPPTDEAGASSRAAASTRNGLGRAGATVASAMSIMAQIGQLEQENVEDARTLIAKLPDAIKDTAREPYGARAIVYSLVLSKSQSMRSQQLLHLKHHAEVDAYELTLWLVSKMDDLDIKFRLPLIQIAIAALKQLSLKQYKTLKSNLTALIQMDAQVDLITWSMQKIVLNHLDQQFLEEAPIEARYSDLGSFKKEMVVLLSLLAHAGHPDPDQRAAQSAFAVAMQTLKFSGVDLLAPHDIRLADLDLALQKMDVLKPLAKSKFVMACVTSIWHDQRVTVVEHELLRAFVGALDCPMPPIGVAAPTEMRSAQGVA